jgi:hypothetical protein
VYIPDGMAAETLAASHSWVDDRNANCPPIENIAAPKLTKLIVRIPTEKIQFKSRNVE